MMNKITPADKLSKITSYWNPAIIAELNGQHVKVAKFKGEFVWHRHETEDEMFLVVDGSFTMEFRNKKVNLTKGEMIVVPAGVEHRPVAEEEVSVMLFEPAGTVNTGDTESELTRDQLVHL